MATGAYTVAFDAARRSATTTSTTQWTLPLSLLLGAFVTAVLGLVIGLAAARLRGPYLAGLTLAVAVAVPAITSAFDGVFKGDQGLSVPVQPPPASLGETFPHEQWQAWFGVIAAAVVLFLLANLVRRGFGRTLRAVRDNEVSAQLAGIHVARTQVITFVVSAACAGLGGGVIAAINQAVSPGRVSLTLVAVSPARHRARWPWESDRRRLGGDRDRRPALPHDSADEQLHAVARRRP